jgi:YD repeat-containing protein
MTACKKEKAKTDDPVVYPPQNNYQTVKQLDVTTHGNFLTHYTFNYGEQRIQSINNAAPPGYSMKMDYSGTRLSGISVYNVNQIYMGALSVFYNPGGFMSRVKYIGNEHPWYEIRFTYAGNDRLQSAEIDQYDLNTSQVTPSATMRFHYDAAGNISSTIIKNVDAPVYTDSVVYTYNTTPNRFRLDIPCIALIANILEDRGMDLPFIVSGLKYMSPNYALSETHYTNFPNPENVNFSIITAVNNQLMYMDGSNGTRIMPVY